MKKVVRVVSEASEKIARAKSGEKKEENENLMVNCIQWMLLAVHRCLVYFFLLTLDKEKEQKKWNC